MKNICSVFILPVALLGSLSADGGEKPFFEELTLDLPGKVQLVVGADLDKNGAGEAVIVLKEGQYPDLKTSLKVVGFSKNDSDRISSKELYEIPIEPKIAVFDMARMTKEEVAFYGISKGGVFLFGSKNGSYLEKMIISCETIFGLAENGNSAYLNFAEDYNQDGKEEILLPVADGFKMYSSTDGSNWKEVVHFTVPPKYFYRTSYRDLPFEMKFSVRGSTWVPQIINLDFNADRIRDILFLWDDELFVFYGNEKGSFSQANSSSHFFKDLNSEERDERSAYVTYVIDDLNADGIADLVKNKFKGLFTSLKTETEILFRDNPGQISGKKIQMNPDGNIGQGGITIDLNGDGKKDFVTASSSFGLFAIIKALLKGKVDVKFSFYFYNDLKGYKESADFSRTLTLDFDLKSAEIMGLFPNLDADLNGDGLKDAFFSPNMNEIRVLFNLPPHRFELDDTKKCKTKISREFEIFDFDGDGKSDLAFYFKKGENRNKVKFLFSRAVLQNP
jgi:hypothetical protein